VNGTYQIDDSLPVPAFTGPVLVELDQVIESATCSCSAGDDNLH
jgi:hypothetical protein